jgi:taurine dioxygenase
LLAFYQFACHAFLSVWRIENREKIKMAKLEARPLHPAFGVEVVGLTPRAPLDGGTLQFLRNQFDDKGLLVFRGLDADLAFQTYLSYALIGRSVPEKTELPPQADLRREYFVSNKEPGGGAPFGRLMFHSDMMWRADAFQLLSLYGVEVAEPALPTMFVSVAHGWKTLPSDLRAQAEGRFAIHGQDASYDKRASADADVLVSKFAIEETVRLPIGYRHPRTGEMLLYVAQQFTQGIADLPSDEGEALLEKLFQHLYAPENVVEHHWRKGDLVMWDNLALQHARPNVTSEGPVRTLRKTMAPMPKVLETAPQLSRAGAAA